MQSSPASSKSLTVYAILTGILGTICGTVVGAIPGMIAYRAAIQSGGVVVEYFLMIVAAFSLWLSSFFMMIVTGSKNRLTRIKRTAFIAISMIPGATLWIGIGLTTEPVWFRTTGAVIGVMIGALSLLLPLIDLSNVHKEKS